MPRDPGRGQSGEPVVTDHDTYAALPGVGP